MLKVKMEGRKLGTQCQKMAWKNAKMMVNMETEGNAMKYGGKGDAHWSAGAACRSRGTL